MNQLQTKMLELLCELDEICTKHEIKYCLFAGSGLGADRHSGFIPWDDDADIIMTLDNYEKLLRVFDSEAKEGRVLNCLEKNYNYPFTYARYVDITTTAIQRHTAFGGCDPGIKIDIFVVVPTHNDTIKAEEHRLQILAFSEMINPRATMYTHRPEGYRTAYETEKRLYEKWGREKYIRKRMSKLKYYRKNSDKYVLFSGMMCNSYIFDAKILDEIKYVRYENTELPISAYNDEFSRILYGEGWINKPANIDNPGHTYLLDMNRPYTEYVNELWKVTDFQSTESVVANRRDMFIYERDGFKDVIVNNQQLRNLAVEMHADCCFEKLDAGHRNDWRYLHNMFADYYSIQLKRINKVYGLFIKLNTDTFMAAMNSAIMTDNYYEAADIISIGTENQSLSMNNDLELLLYRIGICKDITKALYIRTDFGSLKNIIEGITDEMVRNSLTVKIAELWLTAVTAKQEELAEVCHRVDLCADELGSSGELMAVKGYCLEKKGDIDAAASVYSEAAETVKNGYLYQWLADKGYNTYEYKYE